MSKADEKNINHFSKGSKWVDCVICGVRIGPGPWRVGSCKRCIADCDHAIETKLRFSGAKKPSFDDKCALLWLSFGLNCYLNSYVQNLMAKLWPDGLGTVPAKGKMPHKYYVPDHRYPRGDGRVYKLAIMLSQVNKEAVAAPAYLLDSVLWFHRPGTGSSYYANSTNPSLGELVKMRAELVPELSWGACVNHAHIWQHSRENDPYIKSAAKNVKAKSKAASPAIDKCPGRRLYRVVNDMLCSNEMGLHICASEDYADWIGKTDGRATTANTMPWGMVVAGLPAAKGWARYLPGRKRLGFKELYLPTHLDGCVVLAPLNDYDEDDDSPCTSRPSSDVPADTSLTELAEPAYTAASEPRPAGAVSQAPAICRDDVICVCCGQSVPAQSSLRSLSDGRHTCSLRCLWYWKQVNCQGFYQSDTGSASSVHWPYWQQLDNSFRDEVVCPNAMPTMWRVTVADLPPELCSLSDMESALWQSGLDGGVMGFRLEITDGALIADCVECGTAQVVASHLTGCVWNHTGCMVHPTITKLPKGAHGSEHVTRMVHGDDIAELLEWSPPTTYNLEARKLNLSRPFKYKTEPCRYFLMGDCWKGDSCTYAHSQDPIGSALVKQASSLIDESAGVSTDLPLPPLSQHPGDVDELERHIKSSVEGFLQVGHCDGDSASESEVISIHDADESSPVADGPGASPDLTPVGTGEELEPPVLLAQPSPHSPLQAVELEDTDVRQELPLDTDDMEPEPEAKQERSEAIWCPDCEMWLNGPTQWEDHKVGKKHKKNLRKAGKQVPG